MGEAMSKAARALLVAAGALLIGTGLVEPAQAAGCFGKRATIVGTNGKDRLVGTQGSDVILGLGGNDRIFGRGGKDLICAGSGNDVVNALTGKDRVNAGSGDDYLDGWSSNDLLLGGGGDDLLFGGPGNDELVGGGGFDLLRAQGGNDRLAGGGGQDLLLGDEGNDALDGGDDFDAASHFLNQGTGVTADLTTGVATSAYSGSDTLAAIEALEGSQFDDSLTGNVGVNFFLPGPGNDAVNGGDGSDALVYLFSTVAVTVNLGAGTATAEGTDTLSFIEEVAGSEFNDSLTGGPGADFLFGFLGDDMLSGLEGDDVLDGSDGTDTGDGGTHVAGDHCLSIEAPTNCEFLGRTSEAHWNVAGVLERTVRLWRVAASLRP